MVARFLIDQLLVATPRLKHSAFAESVIVICDHSQEGAMGLMINQPLALPVAHLLQELTITVDHETAGTQQPLLHGGPLSRERGFVVHGPDQIWRSTLNINGRIGLTTSRDILEHMARDPSAQAPLVILGYAGWSSGQLEQEIAEGAWVFIPFDAALLFETPIDQRWPQALQRAGIDFNRFVPQVGHA